MTRGLLLLKKIIILIRRSENDHAEPSEDNAIPDDVNVVAFDEDEVAKEVASTTGDESDELTDPLSERGPSRVNYPKRALNASRDGIKVSTSEDDSEEGSEADFDMDVRLQE